MTAGGPPGDPPGELPVDSSWRDLALTDPLTGLPNRRRLDEVIAENWHRWIRDRTPVSVLVIDVDHFKVVNDLAGHQAGDACLRTIAATLARACRLPEGLVCRWGGEEFVAVLPDADAEFGAAIARRTLQAIRDLAVPRTAAAATVTVSIGIASCVPTAEQTAADLIARADRALYAAKRAGRDRAIAGD